MSNQVIERKPNGQFAPGVSGNLGGNAQRTRHAFSKAFVTALARDFEAHGEEMFKRVRRESPASYLKVCAMLVPKELKIEPSGGVKAMTDEQLDRAIAFIEEQLAKRDGSSAKVINADPLDVVSDSDNRNSD